MTYTEDDYLLLSGIQHFAFCRRQWALIHIEQQWDENLRTVEGHIMHERAHDEKIAEKRNGVIITRSMAISSQELGLSGSCDVVEFQENPDGIKLFKHRGLYLPIPIEYKRGKPKKNGEDELQLCAQAMCLEEMLVCQVPKGYLFYGETKRRTEVLFSDELRESVRNMTEEMHQMYRRRYTPKVKTGPQCKSCSLKELCLPKLCKNKNVAEYIDKRLKDTL